MQRTKKSEMDWADAMWVREQLLLECEASYRDFSSGLLPEISKETILGVRLPKLRKMAEHIAAGDFVRYLENARQDYFEEAMLKGMVIGSAPVNLGVRQEWMRNWLPTIDNWSVCDSFCATLKDTQTYQKEMWDFLKSYMDSTEPYILRFVLVMLLQYYQKEPYRTPAFQWIGKLRHTSYYVKMAQAWALSVFYLRMPTEVEELLKKQVLDEETHQKTIQKIVDSRRVDPKSKARIRGFRRSIKRSKKADETKPDAKIG